MVSLVWLTQPKMYVCEIRGVVFVTFVSEENKEHALDFETEEIAEKWRSVLSDMTGIELSVYVDYGKIKEPV